MFSPIALPAAFFLTAAIYASVGFGGGSTYTALLALSLDDVRLVPILSLSCNIAVVGLGSYWAVARRAFDWRLAAPFILASVPFAFIGGLIPLRDDIYLLLLAISLLAAGARLLFMHDTPPDAPTRAQNTPRALFIGATLGLLSGMVGIGGGIFLAPLLHSLYWGHAKAIAAMASFFILVNSLAGLAGQLTKIGSSAVPQITDMLFPLLIMVALGAWVGGRFLLERFSHHKLRQITAFLIIFVAFRLLWQLYF